MSKTATRLLSSAGPLQRQLVDVILSAAAVRDPACTPVTALYNVELRATIPAQDGKVQDIIGRPTSFYSIFHRTELSSYVQEMTGTEVVQILYYFLGSVKNAFDQIKSGKRYPLALGEISVRFTGMQDPNVAEHILADRLAESLTRLTVACQISGKANTVRSL